MNLIFEKKLSDLREEAQREGLPAIHLALHMVHACYLEGMQKDFAKHCADFSIHKISPGSSVGHIEHPA